MRSAERLLGLSIYQLLRDRPECKIGDFGMLTPLEAIPIIHHLKGMNNRFNGPVSGVNN